MLAIDSAIFEETQPQRVSPNLPSCISTPTQRESDCEIPTRDLEREKQRGSLLCRPLSRSLAVPRTGEMHSSALCSNYVLLTMQIPCRSTCAVVLHTALHWPCLHSFL